MIEIIPRRLRIDFDSAPVHWATNREFAGIMNSQSPIAPHLEPYLNKVMEQIRDGLPETRAKLRNELNLFISQEANHYILHSRYNKRLYEFYPALKGPELELNRDYKTFLADKSLTFNAAYCAGFETIATFQAKFYYERADDFFEGADPRIAALFKWHFAEEFEHRCVAHDAFAAVSGNYFWRIYGALYALLHLGKYAKALKKIILEKNRETMTAEEISQSRKSEKAFSRRVAFFTVPRMLRILLPYYNPGKQTAPKSLHESLTYYAKLASDPTLKPS